MYDDLSDFWHVRLLSHQSPITGLDNFSSICTIMIRQSTVLKNKLVNRFCAYIFAIITS